MSKYLERDKALSFPFANDQYDHENANEHFIFGCETYKEWLETLPSVEVEKNTLSYRDYKDIACTLILAVGLFVNAMVLIWK